MSSAIRSHRLHFHCFSTVLATLFVALTALKPWSLTGQENRAKDSGIVCLHSDGNTDSVIEISLHDKKVRKPKFRQPFKPSYLSIALASDGKTFAYHIDDEDLKIEDPEMAGPAPSVWIRSLDHPEKEAIDLAVKGQCICWSPDGKQILVVDEGLNHSFVDVATKKVTPLEMPKLDKDAGNQDKSRMGVTDWSRDGQWLLVTYIANADAKQEKIGAEMLLVKPDGSDIRRLDHIKNGESGRFSPDGKRILYRGPHTKEANSSDLYVTDLKGAKPVRVSHALNGTVDSYCWSPDGKRIAYDWWVQGEDSSVESFVIVVDVDGRNSETLLSEKSSNVMSFRSLHWR